MVDPDPGHRPRRALIEPAEAGDDGQAAAPPPADGPRPEAPTAAPAGPPAPTSAGAEAPKPLYRDEVGPDGRAGAAAGGAGAVGEETKIVRPLNFRKRERRSEDEDATALLARTPSGGRRPAPDRDDLDSDDEHHHSFLGRRARLALLVGAMAAVIAVGIALIYAVSGVGNPSALPSASAPAGTGSASGTASASVDPGGPLPEEQLLTPAAAEQIDGKRTWKVALTQRPAGADAPTPACMSVEPAEGQPPALQKVVQLLTSDGKNAPSALHQASSYATPEDAAQAYAVATRTLGGCAAPGSYIASGNTVTGLGDQAVGLVVNVVTDGKTQLHSVVLSRTGTVVNVVDGAQPARPLTVTGVAKALGAVIASQCEAAGGACTNSPVVKAAPPPLGGDVPGFLATGDLPPAGKADETWVATPAEQPNEDFLGSQCETVNWSRVDAETASTRVYLVASSTKFGLNDIVLTMKSEKAASGLVAKIKSDLDSCSKRKLTATVSGPQKVEGVGAQGAAVTGWTSSVSQKSTSGTQRYRVGIVSSGAKVAYTFLNPLPGGYDLTGAEWDMVAVRAGQRMTQLP